MNLVTGATGHIGNVLVRQLLAQGEPVRAMILPGEPRSPLQNLDVEIVEANVLDYPAVQAAMQDVQTVFHLAGMISILPGRDALLELVNITGTRNVIHAARQVGVRRLVYTSSIHALARLPHGMVIDEQTPFDPQGAISAYDHSKAAASLLVLEAASQGLDAVVVCPTGVIGPYDFRQSEMGVLIQGVLRRRPQVIVPGAYDFVDVRDVATGHILAARHGQTGRTYILSGERISLRRILQTVQEVSGRRVALWQAPNVLAHWLAGLAPLWHRLTRQIPRLTPYSLATVQSNSVISRERAQSELGYQPRRLVYSLADAVRWYLNPLSVEY